MTKAYGKGQNLTPPPAIRKHHTTKTARNKKVITCQHIDYLCGDVLLSNITFLIFAVLVV